MNQYLITNELFDRIMSYVYDFNPGSIEIEPRTDYSGRSMYGAECIGIVTDNPMFVAMALTVALNDLEQDDALGTVDGEPFGWYDLSVRTDSMGRSSSILYFPNLALATSE